MYKTIRSLLVTNKVTWRDRFWSKLVSSVALISIAQIQTVQAQSVNHELVKQEESNAVNAPHSNFEAIAKLEISPSTASNFDSNLLTIETTPQKITVKNFKVVGSSVFSQQELSTLLEKYRNRPLSLTELYQVRSEITKLYTDRGYVNSGAYIPPQELKAETVTIAVVEGKLEDIEITGTKHLNQNYIRSRIAQGAGTPINVESLLEALQSLRLDPLIKTVSAELSAGVTPGTSLLEVKIEEADPFKITTRLDNKRSPSVGSFRRGVSLTHANLLGLGDKITFDYNNTEGSDSIDTSYSLPFNGKNGTFRVAYGTSSNKIIEKPFTPLDIQSESEYYELGIRQPLVTKPTEELALSVAFSFQESKTKLLDTPFPLSVGADKNGETKIAALRFAQEYINRNDTEILALRSQFSVGLDVLGATENEEGTPDTNFLAWRGQSQWVKRLDEDFLFVLRGDIQFSSTELLPLEQFRVGGVDSVRGYRQDMSLGDNGLFTSAEMRIPILQLKKIDGVVQLTPFIDLGSVWNSDDTELSNDFLASLGIGLNFSIGNAMEARLDWGIPLVDVESQGDSLQKDGIYFTVNWNFL